MELIDTRLYADGLTYKGKAVKEVDHFEFLKTYDINSAKNTIFEATERAASENGYILLNVEINYESGVLYHIFDVNLYYIPPPVTMAVPVIVAFLTAISPIIIAIAAVYIVYMVTKTIEEIFYTPSGTQQGSLGLGGFEKVALVLGLAYIFFGRK